MHILNSSALRLNPITEYVSPGVHVASVGRGAGDVHLSFLRVEAPGEIEPHPAGFHQLFVVLSGAGWIAGPDGIRQPIRAGQVAFVRRGETHAKGSASGMTALMVQVTELFEIPPQAAA